MNLILPSNKEKTLAKWLQSLFKFETTISYHIYDYGKRVCCINIEESNEPYPRLHTNDDSIDWDRGKNSIVVAKLAREVLKKNKIQYFCARKGFSIYTEDLLKFKNLYLNNKLI